MIRENMLPLLAWVLLSGISVTFAATNPTAADDTYNIFKGPNITKLGCPSKCGNLTVPYPFGIGSGSGSGCGINEWFELNCTNAFDHPQALLKDIDEGDMPYIRSFQAFGISHGRVRVSNILLTSNCYNRAAEIIRTGYGLSELSGTPYSYSDLNKLTVIGCDDSGSLSGSGHTGFGSSCDPVCSRPEDVIGGSCSGIGCCQTPLLKGQNYYFADLWSGNNHSDVLSFNPCGYMFVGEQNLFVFRGSSDLSDPNLMQRIRDTVPTVLDWWIGNLSCAQVVKDSGNYACNANSHCIDSDTGLGGYRCSCDTGYQGNPYLHPGCTGLDCIRPISHKDLYAVVDPGGWGFAGHSPCCGARREKKKRGCVQLQRRR